MCVCVALHSLFFPFPLSNMTVISQSNGCYFAADGRVGETSRGRCSCNREQQNSWLVSGRIRWLSFCLPNCTSEHMSVVIPGRNYMRRPWWLAGRKESPYTPQDRWSSFIIQFQESLSLCVPVYASVCNSIIPRTRNCITLRFSMCIVLDARKSSVEFQMIYVWGFKFNI